MSFEKINYRVNYFLIIGLFLILYHGTIAFFRSFPVPIHTDTIPVWTKLVVAFILIPCHELVHLVIGLLVVKNKSKIHLGFIAKRFIVFCNVDGEYSKGGLVLSLMAPFLILSCGLGMVLSVYRISNPLIWLVILYNNIFSVLDIANSFFLMRRVSQKKGIKLQEFDLYIEK